MEFPKSNKVISSDIYFSFWYSNTNCSGELTPAFQSFGKTNEEIIKNRMDITIRNVTESMLTPK